MRRVLAAVALAGGLLVGGATAAQAIDVPNPIGDAIMDKVCPPRQPPYPQSPGAQVVARGGGPGVYANYGYAGLRWTTYDAGCLSMDKADTGIGSQINGMANSVDEMINELQAVALDPDSTTTLDGVVEQAVGGLRSAFWNPWAATGMAVVGLLVVGYTLAGRATEAWTLVGMTALVVTLLFTVMTRPGLPAEIGNGLTSGVAEGVSGALVGATPGGTMPAGATPREKFTEGFYQVSYRAWLEGWSCGDADAERVYGPRLLAAQAFSVADLAAMDRDPKAAERMVKAKNEAWKKVGEDMAKTHPAAYGCWKGEGNSRMGAAVKHAVVSVSAGFWIALGSVALMALRWVLRLAVLFMVTFGALMLFSRRLLDRMQEFVLLGLLGPPFVAAGVGTLLWGYYAILLDRTVSWWMSGVAAFALGLAVFMAKGVIGRAFVGTHAVTRSATTLRQGGKRVKTYVSTHTPHSSGGGGTVVAAAAGGAAGAAVAAATRGAGTNDDARRHDNAQEAAGMDGSRPDRVIYDETAGWQPPADSDAPAQALARMRAMAVLHGQAPARQEYVGEWPPDEPPAEWDGHDGRRPEHTPPPSRTEEPLPPPTAPEYPAGGYGEWQDSEDTARG